ncbi:hypothetical protein M758_UG247500 [Ceratodon purpureus]|nr:hypothetical protein M758_UG247500 [Ceratodon purpureus]
MLPLLAFRTTMELQLPFHCLNFDKDMLIPNTIIIVDLAMILLIVVLASNWLLLSDESLTKHAPSTFWIGLCLATVFLQLQAHIQANMKTQSGGVAICAAGAKGDYLVVNLPFMV